jgi:glycosyltransferase involved in cell wall biosynthesis
VAAQVAAGLARRGHDVRALTAGMRHLPPRETRDGVEIVRVRSFRRREDTCTVPEMALYAATGLWPALREARSWRPDVVHAHFAIPTGLLAAAASILTGLPYVLTAHLGDVPGGVPEQTSHWFRLLGPLPSLIWRRASRVTTVSHFVAGLARSAYGIDPTVIFNGVNPIAPRELQLQRPPRIVMAGRLSVQKNPLLGIKSLACLKNLDWSLDVIGDGPLAAEMRAQARAEGIEGRVVAHGWVSGERVARVMAQADILLMPSLHEGLPVAAVEALQQGLAIVGGRIGGMQDVVEDGRNGFLCDFSPDAFAQKLRLLLTDKALLARTRRASVEKARDFDLEKSVTAYEKVLSSASRGAGS